MTARSAADQALSDRLSRLGIGRNGVAVRPALTDPGPAVVPAVAPRASDGVRQAATAPAPALGRAIPAPLLQVERRIAADDPVYGRWLKIARTRLHDVAAVASRDRRFLDLPPERWLFMDTETTSLHSGAGVWVFMVGMGWFDGDGFVVRQELMSGPEREREFLTAVGARMASAEALVSFHGKSFDVPRLDDRFRLLGLDPPCAGKPHWDLLHVVRRLFRQDWSDCRLRTVESKLLCFDRPGDLPGAECPAQYFAYLRGQAHRLEEVFLHNRLDVASLGAAATSILQGFSGAFEGTAAVRAGIDWVDGGVPDEGGALIRRGVSGPALVPPAVLRHAARRLRRLGDQETARVLRSRAAELEGGAPAVIAARSDPPDGAGLRSVPSTVPAG